jgi:hypothetical protein
MKGKMQTAMQAMNAAKEKLDELKDLRGQLLAAVGDGKLGSMLRCLVGFMQVTPPISRAHVGWVGRFAVALVRCNEGGLALVIIAFVAYRIDQICPYRSTEPSGRQTSNGRSSSKMSPKPSRS